MKTGINLAFFASMVLSVGGQDTTTVAPTDIPTTTNIPTETTTFVEEMTTTYPEEGDRCSKFDEPRSWAPDNTTCCKCKWFRVRCYDYICPDPPSNTTNCETYEKCGCTTYECSDSSESSEESSSSESGRFPFGGRRPFGGGRRGGGGRQGGRRRGGGGGGGRRGGNRGGGRFGGGRFQSQFLTNSNDGAIAYLLNLFD